MTKDAEVDVDRSWGYDCPGVEIVQKAQAKHRLLLLLLLLLLLGGRLTRAEAEEDDAHVVNLLVPVVYLSFPENPSEFLHSSQSAKCLQVIYHTV